MFEGAKTSRTSHKTWFQWLKMIENVFECFFMVVNDKMTTHKTSCELFNWFISLKLSKILVSSLRKFVFKIITAKFYPKNFRIFNPKFAFKIKAPKFCVEIFDFSLQKFAISLLRNFTSKNSTIFAQNY